MNILFLGLGSIGRRNLDACVRTHPGFHYAALRSGSSSSPTPENVQELTSTQAVEAFRPDLTWICNPTHLHLEAVRALSPYSKGFFIEKPLASNSNEAVEIENILTQSGRFFAYGHVLRHHPLIKRTQQLVQSTDGVLGKALSYSAYCGSYLPEWRPGTDYRNSYSAEEKQSGGIALDLIHEFDFSEFFFGSIERIMGIRTKVSELELRGTDLCAVTTVHSSGAIGQIHLDYFRRIARRDFEIVFSNGIIHGDLLTGVLKIQVNGKGMVEETYSISRNELHDLQAKAVIESFQALRPTQKLLQESSQLIRKLEGIQYA